MTVVDRFLDYVKFDTQSDELTNLTPSTPGDSKRECRQRCTYHRFHRPSRHVT